MSRFMRQAGYRLIKKLKLGLVVGLVCLLCIVYTSNTIAQTGSVSSELPNSIVIGVRDIAYPIANNITKSSTDGFCGTFGKILSDKVKPRVVTYVDLTNEYLDSRYRRFDGLRKGTTVIECGPNSASIKGKSIAEGIDFSDTSFYSTGVKLLLKNELANTLVQDLSNGNSFLVGCIKNTTTCDLITQKGLIPKELATLDQALDALNSGTIKIYANTEIILRSLLKYGVKEKLNNKGELLRKSRDPLERSGYTISPSKPGSYITGDIKTEKLVIALAKNTSYHDVLKNVIENVLKSDDVIMAGKQLDEKDPPSPPPTTQPTDGEPNSGKQKHREGNFFIETIIPSLISLCIGVAAQFYSQTVSKKWLHIVANIVTSVAVICSLVWFGFKLGEQDGSRNHTQKSTVQSKVNQKDFSSSASADLHQRTFNQTRVNIGE